MRILLLTQIVPYPPDSGPKVKTYHVLRYLAGRGHRITLATFVRQDEEQHLQSLQPFCAELHAVPLRRSRLADVRAYAQSLRSGLPFLVTRDAKPEMQSLVNKLTREQWFDIVHADQLTMGQYALEVGSWKLEVGNHPSLVFDAHNAVWQIVERAQQTAPFFVRPFLALEAHRIKRYEGALIHQFDHTLAVSAVDRQALLDAANLERENPKSEMPRRTTSGTVPVCNPARGPLRCLQSKISIVPIALDCAAAQPVSRSDHSANIITVSTLFYPPNADGVRWFIREVFPIVRRQMPEATLTIVGARPPQDIVRFATRHSSHVTLTGYVPDLQPYLERAALMVVPVRAASGMRVRILEALARGIPLVTTTTGVEGIEAIHGEHLLVADEPREFAEAVVRLLGNAQLRERLARNGRRLIEEHYDWRVVLPRLEGVYESLVEKTESI